MDIGEIKKEMGSGYGDCGEREGGVYKRWGRLKKTWSLRWRKGFEGLWNENGGCRSEIWGRVVAQVCGNCYTSIKAAINDVVVGGDTKYERLLTGHELILCLHHSDYPYHT